MERKRNFYAGPSIIPVDVLETIASEMVTYKDSGLSIVETSHRSPAYDEVHSLAISLMREIYDIPENFKIMFIQGGATMQFGMLPMNFLTEGKSCDFTLTGTWSKKAYEDAKKVGNVNVIFDGKDQDYFALPKAGELKTTPGAEYLHITSNETIGGVQWKDWPEVDIPLVADMSSDILSRKLPWEKFAVVYGGAQKNLGPAGCAVVIMRDDFVEKSNTNLPVYLQYGVHGKSNSLYNTPPSFTIYVIKLVLERMKKLGGIEAIEKMNKEKSALLYNMIDKSNGFFKSPVPKEIRSDMNVVFTTPNADLDKELIGLTGEAGMVGLKGHRSVGGCRASIYNGMPMESVKILADIMAKFVKAKA